MSEHLANSGLLIAISLPVVQTTMVIGLMIAIWGIRAGKLNLHHKIVYPTIILEWVIFIGWMASRISIHDNNILLGLHRLTRMLALLGSLFLIIFWGILRREVNPRNKSITVPVMKVTIIAWLIAFGLGVALYLQIYVL